jgi:ABC-type spermidine/putrescine transport system permease subunit II
MSGTATRRLAVATVLASLGIGAIAAIALRHRRARGTRPSDEPAVEWRPIPNFKQ